MSLTTVQKYALAQILVCGRIDKQEFKDANEFLGKVQNDTLLDLQKKGVLQETMFEYGEG